MRLVYLERCCIHLFCFIKTRYLSPLEKYIILSWSLIHVNLTDISLFQMLNDLLANIMSERGIPFIAALTSDLHVLPDFHGNRYML